MRQIGRLVSLPCEYMAEYACICVYMCLNVCSGDMPSILDDGAPGHNVLI